LGELGSTVVVFIRKTCIKDSHRRFWAIPRVGWETSVHSAAPRKYRRDLIREVGVRKKKTRVGSNKKRKEGVPQTRIKIKGKKVTTKNMSQKSNSWTK